MPDQTPTKIFVSYSWTNEPHKEWVLRLAERLRADGIDVVLDRWDLQEGQDTLSFMEQMVTDPAINKVLAVCDRVYCEKANGRRGGVGTESQIISREMYQKVQQEKFVPVVRELSEDGKPALPVFFGSRLYLDFTDEERFEEAYERLLRNLHGRPELVKPPVGKAPAHLFTEPATQLATAGRLAALKDSFKRGRPHTDLMVRDYLETLLTAIDDHRVVPARGSEDPPFDERLVQALASFVPYRDNFVEFVNITGLHMDPAAFEECMAPFLESLLERHYHRETTGSWVEHSFDFDKFLSFELFLYMLATLIMSGRVATAARLIEGQYTYPARYRQSFMTSGIAAFRPWLRSLEESRRARLNLKWISVTAQLMKDRATIPTVPFRRLAEVDFLLCVRPFFPKAGGMGTWYPLLAPYLEDGGALELFARAATPRGFRPLQELLRVKTLGDLVGQIDQMMGNQSFQKVIGGDRFMHLDPSTLLSLEELRLLSR